MISLSAVRLFVRVADFGSIASAARELRIAPSVASRQIAALERWFGTKLLLRTTRQVSLTQAGSTFLEWARSTDASLEELRDDLGAMQHRPSGIIRLSCNDYAATALLPPVLARFCHDYPEVRVQLTTSNDPAALLREGCELAMHAGRAPDVDVICRRVLSYRRRLCAAPAYLEHRGTPTIIADLAAHNCITHTHGERNSWSFVQGGGIVSQAIQPYIECDNFQSIIRFVIAGLGIARLADGILTSAMEQNRLVEVLPHHPCVYADGGQPGTWLLFPTKHLLFRTRLLADYIAAHLERVGNGAQLELGQS